MNIFINYKIKLIEFFKNLEKDKIIKLPKKFDNFSVEIPKIKIHGDLSTNAPMIFAKENNLNPIDLAIIIKKELEGKFKEIIKIEVAKPGFLNFFFEKKFWYDFILSVDSDFGKNQNLESKKILIEYVSANPTGPLHVGHCRGAVFGDILANLLSFVGNKVVKEYYINDYGNQINQFVKSVYYRILEIKNNTLFPGDQDLYPGEYVVDIAKNILKKNNLFTVCEEASCPNINECWSKKHATFMIMGDTCTRACAFCNVKTGIPQSLDLLEPKKIAQSVNDLKLLHVVITSVDRDDLEDGGAKHFANVISEIKKYNNKTTVEVLTPDFLRKGDVYKIVVDAKPDVFNHNLETIPRLYLKVRPGSRYFQSLDLLRKVKDYNSTIFTKSGLMVGLGETKEEIMQVMDDLRVAGVDFLTIGQYLQPSAKHYPIKNFVTPEEFENYKLIAEGKGFLLVSSSPLTRSSYHASEDFDVLKRKRINKLI